MEEHLTAGPGAWGCGPAARPFPTVPSVRGRCPFCAAARTALSGLTALHQPTTRLRDATPITSMNDVRHAWLRSCALWGYPVLAGYISTRDKIGKFLTLSFCMRPEALNR